MSDSLADVVLTIEDVELVHDRVFAASMDAGWPMSSWDDPWEAAWESLLSSVAYGCDLGEYTAPAEVAAAVWVRGAMVQVPTFDGNKRMAVGAMETQLLKFGYVVASEVDELATATLDIVETHERERNRDALVAQYAVWLDDRMEPCR